MSVANSYARALFQAAKESGMSNDDIRGLETELDAMVQVAESSRDARIVLYGPVVTAKEKAAVVEALSQRLGLARLTIEFLLLLARKERLNRLPAIRDAFVSVRLLEEGGIPGKLVSAEPINQSDIDGLAQAFTKKLGKKVAFQASTDPNLLAGMKVTVNGVTYDGTLRSQLQQLRDRVLSAHQSSTSH